jgi:hypothetical protein
MTSAQNAISDIISSIAEETGAILMDVHKVRPVVIQNTLLPSHPLDELEQDAVEYEKAYNTVEFAGVVSKQGILTVDNFHPCQVDKIPPCAPGSNGNLLIANAFARALLAVGRSRQAVVKKESR